MKNLYQLMMLGALFLLLSSCPVAAKLTVKVGTPSNVPPFSYLDGNNKPSGLFVEYWKLIEKESAINIEFVALPWQDVINEYEQGNVDSTIFIPVSLTTPKDQYASVLDGFHDFYLADPNIDNIDQLRNKSIGVVKGTFHHEYLTKNSPWIEVKQFNTLKELYQATAEGEISGFFTERQAATAIILKYDSDKHISRLQHQTVELPFQLRLPKNRDMYSAIKQAVSAIDTHHISALQSQWQLNAAMFDQQNNQPKITLTSSERKWLTLNDTALALHTDWKPLSYMNAGVLIGFHVDLIDLINNNLNIALEVKPHEHWDIAIEAVKAQELAGIMGVAPSSERQKHFIFSASYLYTPTEVVMRNTNNTPHSFASLDGLNVLVFQKQITNSLVREQSPDAKLIYVDTNESLFKLLASGDGDVALMSMASGHDLERYGLHITNRIFNDVGKYTVAVNKNNSTLHQIIDKGIASISAQQMARLKKKWIVKHHSSSLFTPQEQEYINSQPAITVGVEQWSPIIFANKDGVAQGITGDFLKEIASISGLKFTYRADFWTDLVDDFKANKIDILPATIQTQQRATWGKFSDSYMDFDYALYVHRSQHNLQSIEDLRYKRLAIPRGNSAIDYLTRQFPEINLVICQSLAECIGKVERREVEGVIDITLALQDRLTQLRNNRLRRISLPSLPKRFLRVLSQQDNSVLASIINKSLLSISPAKRRRILANWLAPEHKHSVNVALFNSLPPYVIEHDSIKGIVADLIKNTLAMSDVKIAKTSLHSFSKLNTVLEQQSNIEVDVALNTLDIPGGFYSDNLFQFEDIAVSRASDNLFISEVSDLIGKRISAFPNASSNLSPEYSRLFSPPQAPDNYIEQDNNEQVQALLSGETDVIILDKKSFIWLAREQGYQDLEQFQFSYIFPAVSPVRLLFRDPSLRDLFNINLDELKQSGAYEHIVDDYLLGRAKAKRQFNLFAAALIAQSLNDGDTSMLLSYITKLRELNFIDHIRVDNNEGTSLLDTNDSHPFIASGENSYYVDGNQTKLVGSIAIEYNNEKLPNLVDSSALIPSKALFYSNENAEFINALYQKFDAHDSSLKLTAKEQAFLEQHPVITYSETTWSPLSIVKDGKFSGIVADYMALIGDKVGMQFKLVHSDSFGEVQQKLIDHHIDIVPSMVKQDIDVLFSAPFAEFSYAIITRQQHQYVNDINELAGKKVALPNYYPAQQEVSKHYPDLVISQTGTVRGALRQVRDGEADAFVGHLAMSIYQLQHNFPDLKVSGTIEQSYQHRVAVSQKYPQLLSIINKAISEITPQERQQIYNRWIGVDVIEGIDYTLVYQTIIVFTFILLVGLYFLRLLVNTNRAAATANSKLEHTVSELTVTQTQLTNTIDSLKSAQQQLVDSEKMASLGGLVAGVAHELNTPVGIGLTGISHFQLLSNELNEKYAQKEMSKNDFEKYLANSQEAARLIRSNLEKTADLVHSFKQLSVDQMNDQQRMFNLTGYIDETLVSVRSVIKNKQLTIATNMPQQLEIMGYPGAISQIVTNLVLNSSIHAFSSNMSGQITIALDQHQQDITLTISDNGIGIKPELIDKIFDPFFTTNRQNGGSGLGLNIVYNIVTNQLNGTISCDSKLTQGTSFIICFTTA